MLNMALFYEILQKILPEDTAEDLKRACEDFEKVLQSFGKHGCKNEGGNYMKKRLSRWIAGMLAVIMVFL